jgi:protein-tyrosine phosphatase
VLEGASNFRDLGGLATDDGSIVRHGTLFRSNALSLITPGDRCILDGLGIKSVIDLRSASERHTAPSKWAPTGGTVHVSPKADMTQETQRMTAPFEDEQEILWRDRFDAFYARLPFTYQDEYRRLFGALLVPGPPVLVHCSAGKDRTGVGIALVLRALGVRVSHIVDDYMETSRRLLASQGANAMIAAGMNNHEEALSPLARLVLMGTQVSAIESAFSAIDRRHGSFAAYLEALGLDDSKRSRLRLLLTG